MKSKIKKINRTFSEHFQTAKTEIKKVSLRNVTGQSEDY